jgi:hypothetical protein
MDYLDPQKKRKHKVQLLVGYGLFAVAIGFATLLLVYISNGYYIDRGTGQVIQNGLVYVDSRPGGANIFLNGQQQRGTTDARLVLPSGVYDIGLKRAGYRDWNRNLILEGGSLRRLTYARLIPEELSSTTGTALRADPIFASQSIDKRWVVLSYAENPLQLQIIDTKSASIMPTNINIPPTIVPAPVNGFVEIVEWADDNKTFIAKYSAGNQINYLLVDRENQDNVQNLTTLFVDTTYEIQFQDRKKDKFFVYQPATQSLFSATLSGGINQTPVVVKAREFKTFGNDWVLYVTDSGEEGLVDVRFKRGSKDILLKKVKTADTYLLQLAKLGNAPVMGVSSPVENRAIIYFDPEAYLNNNPDAKMPIATTVLRVANPVDLRISSDSSVIITYGSENFASHEFEDDRSYTFKIDVPIDQTQEIRWLDGQHFLFSSDGVQVMMDFDGSNMYRLAPSIQSLGSFYSDDIETMFSFTSSAGASDNSPQIPAAISVTSLLAPEDR